MDSAAAGGKLVFTFPGQGSYHAQVLAELFERYPYRAQFETADRTSRRILGHEFLPLAAANPVHREQALTACPYLDQVAIYVTDVLIADLLMNAGVRPDLLLGHSFGELAALAVGGAYSFETGLKMVCQRSIALQPLRAAGKMAAVSCGPEQAARLIQAGGGKTLQIAVLNHDRQTVISGDAVELSQLSEVAARQGIGLTILRSRYPFHSALLGPAVAPFRAALCSYEFQPPATPVYLGTEDKFYGAECDLADILSVQFIQKLDFAGILRKLYESGCGRFIECGAGDVLTGIVSKALSGRAGLICRACAHPDTGVAAGSAAIFEEFERRSPGQVVDSIPELLQDVQAVLKRTSQILERAAGPKVAPVASLQPGVEEKPQLEAGSLPHEPIAIVAMGCVLPGARDAEEYWNHIQNSVSGIVDPGRDDPTLAQDFLAGRNGANFSIVPDKTYTLLYGSVGTIAYDPRLLSSTIDEARFQSFSRAEKLLALAAAQSLAALKTSLERYPGDRLQCIIGASGDGCGEYDEALFLESLQQRLKAVEPDPELRTKFSAVLKKAWDNQFAGTPGAKYQDVVDTVLGRPVRMYVVDAACSSSLYSIHLGMRALQNHNADAVLAAGVFAPGPANSALFAQFRGLTAEACRPLDAAADGVVFGHGAGVLVLKRLTDAVADGDRIVGVVRAVGISSDGKSPAINVPQSKGQSLAVRRAYETSGIDVDTIQYVEAHATGTPVGDAVEFQALRESLPRSAGLTPIELGSIKSLIGHTGWAAGVASVIKLCKAFEAQTVPGQFNFSSTGPEIPLEGSQFTISKTAHAWPENVAGAPRRAAINGFGFGGTNAHLVLEEYNASYHKKLCGRALATPPARLAVIHWAALFPSRQELAAAAPNGERRFDRKLLRLPKGKMLLPDVREHMDPCQYLVTLAAEQVLARIPDQWPKLRSEIGVVLGVEGKTECGMQVNQRIFLDRLRRRVSECAENGFQQDKIEILDRLSAAIKNDILPSGPYTLPGLMPNLVAGRVSQMFDLHGPNIVVDMGAGSLFQSIDVAAGFLAHQECKIVLAGGVNAARTSPEDVEGAFMMALTTPEIAKEHDLPIDCYVSIGEDGGVQASSTETQNYRGAHGMVEISRALANHNGQVVSLCRTVPQVRTGPPEPASTPTVASAGSAAAFDSTWGATNSPYVYVQGTPIYYYTPVMVPAEPEIAPRPVSLLSRKLLFLTDRPERWVRLERSGALAGLSFQVLGPMESEEKLTASLDRLTGSFDTIIAVQSLDDSTGSSILASRYPALPDLLFTVCKHVYAGIESQQIWVASVSLNAFRAQHLDPHTGLAAGFLKALARELPGSTCRIVNTDESNLSTALRQLEAEFGRLSDGSEICYRGGKRHSISLEKVERLSDASGPLLDAGSVVLATGGGRGVTAVLAEELLTRFGCTVIALGRTDPASAPPHILAMDEAQLVQYEAQFYKEQIARGTGKKIIELKKEFKNYQSVLEVSQTVRRLSALPGRFEYISADLTNSQSVASIVESLFDKYGRLDLVLHGAGVQVSKVLPKKSLRDFQSVVSAKLESLRHIYQACEKHPGGRPTGYHILTSAFSYMGNDGQEDYGAANETLNRLAAVMNDPRGAPWTSVAWLGWAGIGMTRGLEYAALAAHRGLRGVTKEEGQKIFSELLNGHATTPINVILADGEIEFYKVKTVKTAAPARKNSIVIEREVSAENAPYVWDHLVDGIPTMPGVFLMILIAEAALELRPNLKITAFEDAAFRRFVRMRREGSTTLRLHASVISEDVGSTVVRVAILADFIHKNGTVLQKDVEQTAVSVRLASAVAAAPVNGTKSPLDRGRMQDSALEDPYLMDGSPVKLGGPFRSMQNITAGLAERSADYRLREEARSPGYRYLNLIMLDALVRFGGIYRDGQERFPIYVPEACRVMKIYYDFTNPDEKTFTGSLRFAGSNPHLEAGVLTIGPVEAMDPAGRTLAMVEGGLCRKMGEARNGK
jgi:3-oxoacyl-(acyl-carrier-protein) synthase/NAD(P)-dependent dehydrogenase (short-subunit alcohol dehydrogenase family)